MPQEQSRRSYVSAFNSLPTVIGHDSDWQYPAITEKHAFHMAKRALTGCDPSGYVVYFGFPWATLIDFLQCNLENPNTRILASALRRFKEQLKRYRKVITVCQHIHLRKYGWLFDDIGVTDIFWSHAVRGQSMLQGSGDIRLHPFPLYPVQAIGVSREPSQTRTWLYSFVGARARDFYLTNTRNWILDELSNDARGVIIGRDFWHYKKIVYECQISNKECPADEELIDESASRQFRQVLNASLFSLCPSGSGPNSIRLWESIAYGAIPVLLADAYLPPGDQRLWDAATVSCKETLDDVKSLPDRLELLSKNPEAISRKRRALKALLTLYGPESFISDIQALFLEYARNEVAIRAETRI